MKILTKNIPTQFVEFDNGAVMKLEKLIEDLVSMATSDFTWFDLDFSEYAGEWEYIQSECVQNRDEIIENIIKENNKLKVIWKYGVPKGELFGRLICELSKAE